MGMIRDMPGSERPREKAQKYGLRSLSTRELIALIVRSGTKGCSALDVADEILSFCGGAGGLSRMSIQELSMIRGMSKTKSAELLAGFELARRTAYEQTAGTDVIDNPERLVGWLQKELGSSMQEKFLVVYLDNMHRIISYRTLFIGTINASAVFPREIFKEALLENSTDLMLVHNHPSGNTAASMQDIVLTDRVVRAGKLLGIRVLDHLIITQTSFLSFSRERILEDGNVNIPDV